ncbi:MAG TPA: hypothetical protein PK014_02165 [Thermoanaerobaculia bacterium]|nr:hypothetical protein [Thermoanaerobaculia bacterium]HUM28962.1 hypothetical protein [Thermoanaerobaculia bacterium]HXK67106.1 hypothetical protein [Thermoanaerobaculia bacterium]
MNPGRISLLYLLFILTAFTGFSQTCPQLVAEWAYGPAERLVLNGSYLYFGAGKYLIVYDISDPSQPVKTYEHRETALIHCLAAESGLLYSSRGGYLVIHDISVPDEPVELGTFDLVNSMDNCDREGSFLYIAEELSGLRILDLSDPYLPVQAGVLDTAGVARDVQVIPGYAFIADEANGLRIIDISDPSSPFEAASWTQTPFVIDLELTGTLLYLLDRNEGLRILDISNPLAPIELGAFDLVPQSYSRFEKWGNRLHVSFTGSRGFFIVDVSDPGNPTFMGQDSTCYALDIATSGDTDFLIEPSRGIRLFTVSDPSTITLSTSILLPGPIERVEPAFPYLYTAARTEGIYAFDISTPSAPVPLSIYPYNARAASLTADNGYLYVSDYDKNFYVLNVTDPFSPFLEGSAPILDIPVESRMYGPYVLVTDYIRGLVVVDVSNPTNPFEANCYLPGGERGVKFDMLGSIAYVTAGNQGLRVLDISDPLNIQEVDSYVTGDYANLARIDGARLFVGFTAGWPPTEYIHVFDITDPAHPVLVQANLNLAPEVGAEVLGMGDLLFSTNTGPVWAHNIRDLTAPQLLGHYFNGFISQIKQDHSYLFVPHTISGFSILDPMGCYPACVSDLGDLNFSSSITGVDAAIILQEVVGLIVLDSEQMCRADVNASDSVTSLDAAFSLMCTVGDCGGLPFAFAPSCEDHGNCL